MGHNVSTMKIIYTVEKELLIGAEKLIKILQIIPDCIGKFRVFVDVVFVSLFCNLQAGNGNISKWSGSKDYTTSCSMCNRCYANLNILRRHKLIAFYICRIRIDV